MFFALDGDTINVITYNKEKVRLEDARHVVVVLAKATVMVKLNHRVKV